MTIGEVSRLTGVTIRTLRHYDRIGLLPPSQVTEAGYRLYDQRSLERLHAILMLRETGLSLEAIRRLLDHPGSHRQRLLALQQALLTMQRQHIDRLLERTRELMEKGETPMDFDAIHHRRAEDLAAQAQAAWSHTPAWQDYAARPRSAAADEASGKALMRLLGEFGRTRPASPEAPQARAFVRELQRFITGRFYTCTDEALLGLADVYETPDFRRSIDREGGEGTAAFLAEAIRRCLGEG